MSQSSITLPFVCAALAIAALSSLPAISAIAKQLHNNQPRNCFYEDADGYAQPETIGQFSNQAVKTVILLLSALGLGSAVVLLILSSLPEEKDRQVVQEIGLLTITWCFILIQSSCIAVHYSSQICYSLGIWLLASSITLTTFSCWQSIQVIPRLNISYRDPTAVTWIAHSLIGLGLGISSSLFPQRPDVVFNDCNVDRQRTTSALSRYTWSWIQPLLLQASIKNDLDAGDIPHADHMLRSEQRKKDWDDLKPQASLVRSILSAYRKRLVLIWSVTIVGSCVSILPFWAMLSILNILEDQETTGSHCLKMVSLIIGMAIFNLLDAWMEGWLFWSSVSDLSLPIRAQLSSLVFAKTLRKKNIKSAVETKHGASESLGKNSGKGNPKEHNDPGFLPTDEVSAVEPRQAIVNLVGVDAERIAYFFQYQFLIVNGVFKLAIFFAFLVRLIGWIPLGAGTLTWALMLLASIWFSNLLLVQSKSLMQLRDAKLAKVNEALLGIRQIKFSALESQWGARILALRKRELEALWRYFIADSALFGCWVLSPILLAATSLAVYANINGSLSPAVAFVSIGMFSTLERTLGSLPELVTLGIDTMVSIKRVGTYLNGPELQSTVTPGPIISFEGATIAWPADDQSEDADRFTLHGLQLSFPNGQLSVISGKTGSGKSLLVSAILGETDLLKGSICVPQTSQPTMTPGTQENTVNPASWIIPGSLAYVSQTSWLENASLRNNILFGLPLVKERYDDVIEVCALKHDLAILIDGDETELGANGVNLSGGQKWRITLARAIYSRSEILVLEDILSAVDAHVGRWIVEMCLGGKICEGRTRILVTHNLGLVLPQAKYLVELGGGTIIYSGSPHQGQPLFVPHRSELGKETRDQKQSLAIENEGLIFRDSVGKADDFQSVVVSSLPKPLRKLVQEETREKGKVKKRVYLAYLDSSGGILLWGVCASFFLAYQIGIVGRGWWLRIWTTGSSFSGSSSSSVGTDDLLSTHYSVPQQYFNKFSGQLLAQKDVFFYLKIYVIISLATAAAGIVRFFWTYFLAIRASRTIFDKLIFTILRAPLPWLDTVPTGRIINRFTADFSNIDQRIPLSGILFFTNLLRLVGICIASFFTSSYLIPSGSILLILGALIGRRYLAGSRPLKRLESNAKSPVFELFNTTLAGISTIRAFQRTRTYLHQMHTSLDRWTMTTFYTSLALRWMSFRMALVASCFCMAVGMVIIFSPAVDAALAGFALSFVLDFSEGIRWTIRCYGDMELDMNSMERVTEYIDVETETLSGYKPPAAWPNAGTIEINNLEVAYGADLPAVLKELSFKVNHRERVGIVGRTGAGKSSIALALFRFLETRSGNIVIDGLDISNITLHDLRSRLAIIPQDPVLFSGTVRSNLDPFDNHTDEEVLQALARVHLIRVQHEHEPSNHDSHVKSNVNFFNNLSSPISESGSNLSQGQRQLLCIARAIIARPKIIVFDEATSAVDVATDMLVQNGIRDGFTDSTLIVIAHRLSTVSDFDKVLVLENGCMTEFGTPQELWEKNGAFRSMCESSNDTEKEKLERDILQLSYSS